MTQLPNILDFNELLDINNSNKKYVKYLYQLKHLNIVLKFIIQIMKK